MCNVPPSFAKASEGARFFISEDLSPRFLKMKRKNAAPPEGETRRVKERRYFAVFGLGGGGIVSGIDRFSKANSGMTSPLVSMSM